MIGDTPDGWLFQNEGETYWWMTTNHDYTVVEWNTGWVIRDPNGDVVPRRFFKTAGAACRSANDLGFG